MSNFNKQTRRKRSRFKQKNRVRGIIGEARKRSFDANPATKLRRPRALLQKTLLDARVQLNIDEYTDFLNWMFVQTRSQIPFMRKLPLGYDYISGIIDARPAPLEKELGWAAARLSVAADTLRDFRTRVTQLETLSWAGDKDRCLAFFDEIETRFGQSLWLIESQIGLTQLFSGLEAQKIYTTNVKKPHGKGLVRYLAHYFSVRNEPNVTMSRFEADTVNQLQNSPLSDDMKVYLTYKITHHLPTTHNGLSAIVRLEQSHSNIDLYETFIAIIQHLISIGMHKDLAASLRKTLLKLAPIADYRLFKALMFLGQDIDQGLEPPHLDAMDNLLAGKSKPSLRAALRAVRRSPLNVRQCQTAALTLAMDPRHKKRDLLIPRTYVIDRLSSLYEKQNNFDNAYNDLQKYCSYLAGLASSVGIRAIVDAEVTTDIDQRKVFERLVSLNIGEIDPFDLQVVNAQAADNIRRFLQCSYAGSLTAAYNNAIITNSTLPNGLCNFARHYGRALQHIGTGNFRDAATELGSQSGSPEPPPPGHCIVINNVLLLASG